MANTTNNLRVIYGDGVLGIHGPHVYYGFSYDRGGLESLAIDGKEWLYRVVRPAFWRATTDNDRGNHFSERSAMWLGADLFSPCVAINVQVDGVDLGLPLAPENNRFSNHELASSVIVTFTYQTTTVPSTTVSIAYTVRTDGALAIHEHFIGQTGLPELPAFGLRLTIPTVASSFDYTGLSGETYPDRMAGGENGSYHVDGLPITPYLVPQEMGMHMDTKQLTVTRQQTLNNADPDTASFSLSVVGTPTFAFSCLPYTPFELENATHIEELPTPRRTVLSLFGAVRGVGGIDSWGADVAAPYHIDATMDHECDFVIEPE